MEITFTIFMIEYDEKTLTFPVIENYEDSVFKDQEKNFALTNTLIDLIQKSDNIKLKGKPLHCFAQPESKEDREYILNRLQKECKNQKYYQILLPIDQNIKDRLGIKGNYEHIAFYAKIHDPLFEAYTDNQFPILTIK